MKRRLRTLIVFAVAAFAAACAASDMTGSGGGPVAWRVQNQRVELTNTSTDAVRYALVGRTFMHSALIDWCFGMPQCGTALPANGTASVAYADISGAAPPESEVMLIWWKPDVTSGSFDSTIVRIR